MTQTDIVNALIQTALGEQGIHEEQGQNIGTCIKYQRVTGNGPGDSWCASFVCWCFKQIGELGVLPRITGSCEELRVAARSKEVLMPIGMLPLPGDIGLVVQNDINHAHHCFIVRSVPDSVGFFQTVEGNSNDDGSSNGNGVYALHKRHGVNDGANNHYEFIRLFDAN